MSKKGLNIEYKHRVSGHFEHHMNIVECIEILNICSRNIEILWTGVCGSDAGAMAGKLPEAIFPFIPGHEAAGVVESVGSGITEFKEGDTVVPLWLSQCEQCYFCKSPKTNVCGKLLATAKLGVMVDGTSRFRCRGKSIHHFLGVSTYSQYAVMDCSSLVKVNPSAPLDKVCLIGCGVPTGYGSALNIAKVEKGSTCAVWGLGTIGLAAVMGCKDAGAARIIGVDVNPAKFELGKQFGVTEFINPKDHEKPVEQVILEMTGGLGCDFTFECVGNINTMKSAIQGSHLMWGKSVMVGVAPAGHEIPVEYKSIWLGRTITAGLFGAYKPRDSIPKLVNQYLDKKFKVDEFVSHTNSLEKINEGFDLLKKGETLRTVIKMH
ncbi:unnamed protein product, partial [Meganyctiphanes norvegica]